MIYTKDEFRILFLDERMQPTIDFGYSLLFIWLNFCHLLHFYSLIGPLISDICIWEVRATFKISFCHLWFSFSLWEIFILSDTIIMISHYFYVLFFLDLEYCWNYQLHNSFNGQQWKEYLGNLRREYLWYLVDALTKENIEIRKPSPL